MGFTRKVREELKRLDYDPALGYRVWPEPNISYKQAVPQTIARTTALANEPEITRQTLLGTLVFLLGLLLVGFVAGYALRGPAYASTAQNNMVSLAMAAVPAASGLDIDSEHSNLVASFGSQAPDELIRFATGSDGSLSALIRVHGNTEQGTDQLSLVQVSASGDAVELHRQDTVGIAAVDMAQLDSGRYVLASLHPGILEMRGLSAQGQNEWSRELNIAINHQAGVKVVSLPTGTVIAGPSEKLDRISLTYLGSDGELLWQRSFAAHTDHPDIWLEPSDDGSVFLATRAPDDGDLQLYSVMHIDFDGQDLWQTSMAVEDRTQFAGLSASGDGGVYALSTGRAPTLTKFDAMGVSAWSVDVPQAKFSNSINLVSASNGNAVVAVSYAVANQRLDVWLEERDDRGRVVREANLTLPDSSSVDALSVTSNERYLLAGSVLPDRFDDADIFVKDVKLKAVTRPVQVMAAAMNVEPDALSDALVDTVDNIAETSIEDAETVDLAGSSIEVSDPESEETSESELILASLESIEAITAPTTDPLLLDAAEEEDAAALSRFVSTDLPALTQLAIIETGTGIQAQCRFSCLEKGNSSASFPMWRAIEAPESAFQIGLPAVHELTCRAAGGTRDAMSKPDCDPS